jgi:hypothetical protein
MRLMSVGLRRSCTRAEGVVLLVVQWCGPCQILAGEMDKVAGLYKDKIRYRHLQHSVVIVSSSAHDPGAGIPHGACSHSCICTLTEVGWRLNISHNAENRPWEPSDQGSSPH